MNDLHPWLDGETPEPSLDPEARRELEAWDRMVASFRASAPRGSAPHRLEQRVMSEIHALPQRTALRAALAWLVRPAPFRVPPLAAVGATAAIIAMLAVSLRGAPTPAPLADAPDAAAVVYVQFLLDAPGATSVAVAGDFTEWQPEHALEDLDGDGIWTGRVPIEPGVHSYMFVIDGREWLTDPLADRYQDDGFGNRNAVLAVVAGA
jgi:hypothetical protein